MTTYIVNYDSKDIEFRNEISVLKYVHSIIDEAEEEKKNIAVHSPGESEFWTSDVDDIEDLEEVMLENLAYAYDEGLSVIWTVTDGRSGCGNFRPTVTGFKNWADLKNFADVNGLNCVKLYKHDGWTSWERRGIAVEPYEIEAETYGYSNEYDCTPEEYYQGCKFILDDCNNIEEAKKFIEYMDHVCDLLEDLEPGQKVLTDPDLYEPMVIDTQAVEYEDGSEHYSMGVIFDY